jgi:uncharacterized protein
MARFLIFIAIVQSILLLGHWFLYRTLLSFLSPLNPLAAFALRIALGLLSVSLVLTSLLSFRYDTQPVRLLYTVAACWLGVLYLLILAGALAWFISGMGGLFHFSFQKRILIAILMGIAGITSLYGFINASVVRVTRITVHIPDLPAPWKGKTALWVSDTHWGHVRNFRFAEGLAARIRSLHPDVVFLGGDLFDGQALDVDRVVEPFSRIAPRLGIYFVTGNHEEFSDNTRYLQAVRRAGIRTLYNEKIEVDGVQIIGVDYRDSRAEEHFRRILRKLEIDRHKPSILLKHAPFDLRVAGEEGIRLQLSGHTHQGQVFLFRFITARVYEGYDYGLKRLGEMLVYTSSGAGTWGPPMRIDTVPEIVLITFKKDTE